MLESDIVPCMMFPPVSPYTRSMSGGASTCRWITEDLKFGAYSLSTSKHRSANLSRSTSQVESFRWYGAYWMNTLRMCLPGGARVESRAVAMVHSSIGSRAQRPYLASSYARSMYSMPGQMCMVP